MTDAVPGCPRSGRGPHAWLGAAHLGRVSLLRLVLRVTGAELAHRDQGQTEVANLCQQSVERGLIREQASDDRLRAIVADLETAKPVRPPVIKDAGRDAPRGAGPVPGLAEQLTARELEVLVLLAAGKPNPRIAVELVVTLDTVKKHVSHLLGKLGAANRTEAVTRARQLGLIP